MTSPATSSKTSRPSGPDPQAEQARLRRRRKTLLGGIGFGLLALTGVALVLYAWQLPPFHSGMQRTENAMVRGQVTLVAPQVSGYVTEVAVQDFERVKRGQLLARIDDRIYRQQLQQAEAQLQAALAALADWDPQRGGAAARTAQAQAQVQAGIAQRDNPGAALQRAERLAGQRLISQQDRDTALASAREARASVADAEAALAAARTAERSVEVGRPSLEAAVASAEAAVQLARINLDNTIILAPRDGRLGQVAVREGAFVATGTQLMALVPGAPWVIANFKETQMAQIRVGQAASFSVDALEGARLRGHVERIAPAAGSEFSVLPPDNATGNFVKIAQRIPVRIAIDPGQPLVERLAPGMSVVVAVDTSQAIDGPAVDGPAAHGPTVDRKPADVR
jgi:multidrug resistance efflux pump